MTNGMKEGAGEDPFAGDTDDAPVERSAGRDTDASAPPADGAPDEAPDSNSDGGSDLPYVLTRDTVKEDRPNEAVAFLRDEYDELEDDVHERVAEEMGMRRKDVPLTDVREAFVALADRHTADLADILLEWGHEHRK